MSDSSSTSTLPNGSADRRRRRTPGEGGLRERSPGHWEIKFDAGRDPQTGKRLTRFVTVRGNKKKALEELAKYRNQAGEGTLLEPAKRIVAVYLEEWLTGVKNRVSRKTHERYAEIVRKHLVPAIGAHPLAKLAPTHLQAYYAATLETPRRRTKRNGVVDELAPLSAHTVKHHHRVLSQALKAAVRLRYLARNPADDVDPPRPSHREMQIIDHAQTAALLKAAEGSAIYVPVLLGVMCGMRRGEILAQRWKDLNLEARTLSVAQTLEETDGPDIAGAGDRQSMRARGLAFKAPKTERSRRTISLPPFTVEALRRHRVRQAEERLKAGKAYAEHDLVCCDALGEPLSPHHVSQVFAKLAARLKLKIRFHDLRHTHISHLLAAGVHPKVASERAGHASVSITLDVYSHLIPGMQEDAANRIDAALRAHLDP